MGPFPPSQKMVSALGMTLGVVISGLPNMLLARVVGVFHCNIINDPLDRV